MLSEVILARGDDDGVCCSWQKEVYEWVDTLMGEWLSGFEGCGTWNVVASVLVMSLYVCLNDPGWQSQRAVSPSVLRAVAAAGHTLP